jgi:hypothetical protein
VIAGITSGASIFVAPAGPDVNTLALLHFDGANGSTTFVDEAGGTWTGSGNAQLNTAQAKFGSSSLLVDGVGDYITLNAPGIAVGSGDFTIEAFVRWIARSSNNFVFTFGATWGVYTFGGTLAVFDGVSANVIQAGSVANTVWYHLALVRQSGTLSLYQDGVRLGQAADSTNHTTTVLSIGAGPTGAGASNANIDEFRLSDIARYSGASFTPIAAAFPDP